MQTTTASPRLGGVWTDTPTGAAPPLLHAVRLWASVCLALFLAFWLELDNPFWAGTSAAVVCQPQLGASLRKGWFRMVGTVLGATTVVVLTACFPQDRIAFLGVLALWGGVCAFAATGSRNFVSYAASLAGYTAVIIAAENLGATGGASPDIFMLAVTRASEICIGIVCAGVVLAGTDLGGAQRRLAGALADLVVEIAGRFTRMLGLAEQLLPDTQAERRELARRVLALDPMIDEALGESSHLRYQSLLLQTAVFGLFRALVGWHGVATRLSRLPEAERREAGTILRIIPPELQSAGNPGSSERWIADPMPLRSGCEGAVRTLLALPAETPSLRLLADESAKVLVGILDVLDGVALLVDAPYRAFAGHRGLRLSVPDWIPALVNAGRASLAISMVELIWVATGWPDGAFAILIAAIVLLLLSPKGDLAPAGALAVTIGVTASIICAATIKFAVLPSLQSFPALCLALGLFLIPAGFSVARWRTPASMAVLSTMTSSFMSLVSPTNQMTYDTAQFYNVAVAVFVGCGVAVLSFQLLPPLSTALRTRRLLALTLRDLRRFATASLLPRLEDWESRVYGRLAALPSEAEPLQHARLLAALSVGRAIINLRHAAPLLRLMTEFNTALEALAQGNSAVAIARLHQLDQRIASNPDTPEPSIALRARSRILVITEAVAEHASYFDARAIA
ncbi:FUSC family protein [Bradyrhizobium sp. F1.13.3]|uniref:FUSC family protein n=1 Tax=Bradyrhizobium sp. F1.13.3 TaxID=3156351 RepID=UPI00339AF76E